MLGTMATAMLLDSAVTNYLKQQIESGDVVKSKKALQELCKRRRQGQRIRPANNAPLLNSVIGQCFGSNDSKVRRWSLNAIALLGTIQQCRDPLLLALKTYQSDPQVVAAGIAAIFRLSGNPMGDLKGLNLDGQTLTLAALQHTTPEKLDLSSLPIKVEISTPAIIKLGLVLIGLDKAPQNIFHLTYSNAEMVKALGTHHDPFVSQYSIWAITENNQLNISHLGIDTQSIEQQPPNVQAWILKLLAQDSLNIDRHMELVKLGKASNDPEVRSGLAQGLKETYSPILQQIVLDWITSEPNSDVRLLLLDHIIIQAERTPYYREFAVEFFEAEVNNSDVHDRMLATASGTSLFAEFKRTELKVNNGLLGVNMTTNNITIGGSVNAAQFTASGNPTNSGTLEFNSQSIEMIKNALARAEEELAKAPISEDDKRGALEKIASTREAPTRENLAKAVSVLSKVEEMSQKALGTGTAIKGIVDLLTTLVGS